LGRTPKEELLREQFERAKQLLISTDLAIHEVANRCGFHEAKGLIAMFHSQIGMPPGSASGARRNGAAKAAAALGDGMTPASKVGWECRA
jgi:transcriptional regulator GlxA family with amidase domain